LLTKEDDEDEIDTDLETDRLLGQHLMMEDGFYDEASWIEEKTQITLLNAPKTSKLSPQKLLNPKLNKSGSSLMRQGFNLLSNSNSMENNCIESPLTLMAERTLKQSRSLKNSPALTNAELIPSDLLSPDLQNDKKFSNNTKTLIDEISNDELSHRSLLDADANCSSNNGNVGEMSFEKIAKDSDVTVEKKKKNKNREGKKRLLNEYENV
jgi:hypothetical protein